MSKVHYKISEAWDCLERPACGRFNMKDDLTYDEKFVTCKKCQKILTGEKV